MKMLMVGLAGGAGGRRSSCTRISQKHAVESGQRYVGEASIAMVFQSFDMQCTEICTWAVQAGQAVPEVLRTLALRALAVQLMDRTRHSSVIAAISIGGQSGLLSQLMHSAVRP